MSVQSEHQEGKLFLRTLTVLICAGSIAAGSTAWATSALGEPTGSRSELTGALDAAGLPGFSISWDITFSSGVYHYSYTLDGPAGPGLGVSHFALELSNNCSASGLTVTNAQVNLQSVESTLTYGCNTSANGDPNYPGNFYGVRFFPATTTQMPITVTFDSVNAPLYADFYTKLGNGGPAGGDSAWNNGSAGLYDTSSLIANYIPVPLDPRLLNFSDTAPEPSTFVLIGTGLLAAGFVKCSSPKRGPRR
jgi:PEP-CTERM motif